MVACAWYVSESAKFPTGCTPTAAQSPAGQATSTPQQLSPDEVFGLIGGGIALFVQTAAGLQQIIAQDSAGNLQTAGGETLPPTTPIVVDTGNGNGNGALDGYMIPLAIGAGVLLLLLVMR